MDNDAVQHEKGQSGAFCHFGFQTRKTAGGLGGTRGSKTKTSIPLWPIKWQKDPTRSPRASGPEPGVIGLCKKEGKGKKTSSGRRRKRISPGGGATKLDPRAKDTEGPLFNN